MHIVQMANFHSPTSGGIKVTLAQLAAQYRAAGHAVTQILPGADSRVDTVEGVSIHSVRAPRVPGLGGYRMVLDLRMLRGLVEHLQPDVLEISDRTTMLTATSPAQRVGVPTVVISHERLDAVLSHVVPVRRPLSAVLRTYNRRMLGRVDAVVCASQFAAAEYRGLDGAPVLQIPLGVDLGRFHPQAGRSETTQRGADTAADAGTDSPDRIRLVAVTRHSPEKDPHLAIAVVAELRRRGRAVCLDMVGSGALTNELRRAAAGLPVEFHGHVADRARVAALLAAADVAVAPGPNETFGLAALEALACGTPVVVPTRGALREMIDSDLVGRAAASTPEAMADAVEQLMVTGDRSMRREACRTRAERFPWSATASALLEAYAALRQVVAA